MMLASLMTFLDAKNQSDLTHKVPRKRTKAERSLKSK